MYTSGDLIIDLMMGPRPVSGADAVRPFVVETEPTSYPSRERARTVCGDVCELCCRGSRD